MFETIVPMIASNWQIFGVILLATMVKILLSEDLSLRTAVASAAMAILSASVFTGPVIGLLGYFAGTDMSSYVLQVAALCTIVGEGVIRWLVKKSKDEAAIGHFLASILQRLLGTKDRDDG